MKRRMPFTLSLIVLFNIFAFVGEHLLTAGSVLETEILPLNPTASFISETNIALTFLSPAADQEFLEGDDLSVEVEAIASSGFVDYVELHLNGTIVGRDFLAPYTWSSQSILMNLAAGDYVLEAIAKDNMGNTFSETMDVVVQEKPLPVVNITTPADGTRFDVGSNISVAATAMDEDGIDKVELFVNGTLVFPDFISPYNWSDHPLLNDLAAGDYTLKAVATDMFGNEGMTENTITVGRLGINELPRVGFANLADGDQFDNGENIPVRAQADDEDGEVVAVELFLNGQSLGVKTEKPYNWSDAPALQSPAPGYYTLVLVATDNDGGEGEASLEVIVRSADGSPIVKITQPTTSDQFAVGDDVDVAAEAIDFDGGIKNMRLYFDDDFISRLSTPPYEWKAADHRELRNLETGDHTIRVIALDNSRNTTEISNTFTVGTNSAPTVSFTKPTNQATFAMGSTIDVEATAMDQDGTISAVDLYLDDQLVGTDNTAPFAWEGSDFSLLQNLQAGKKILKLVAKDNEGATREVVIEITVENATDNISPTVKITNPADGARFAVGHDLVVEANATDEDGSIDNVALFFDEVLVNMDDAPPYFWFGSVYEAIGNLQAGSYTVKVVATDNEGATAVDEVTISVGENLPPMVSFISPTDGQSFITGATLNVQVDASDSDGSVAEVELFYDDSAVGVDAFSPFAWNITDLAVGTHTLRAVATDDQGASTAQSISITVNEVVSDGTPIVTISTPANGQTFPIGTNLTVRASAIDTDGTIRNLRLYFNGEFINKQNGDQATWTAADFRQLANLEAGTYPVRVIALDNKGRTGETTNTITVAANGGGGGNTNMPPMVNITNPSNGQSFTAGENLTVSANASDSDGSIATVELFYNGNSMGKDENSPYVWNLNDLAVGNHRLRVLATDDEGATAESSINITVNPVDGGGGDGNPIVTISTPQNGQTFPVGTNLTVTASTIDTDGSIRNIRLYFNGEFINKQRGSQATWEASDFDQLANLEAGTYPVRVIGLDNKGNTGETTHTIIVSDDDGGGGGNTNVPPMVSFTAPTNGQTFTAGTTISVRANASDSDGSVASVELFYDGNSIGKDDSSPYTWDVNNLTVGDHRLRVLATDNEGATAESNINITVNPSGGGGGDGTPIVTISTPQNGQTFPIGTNLTVTASATDSDGSIRNLRLYFNGEFINKQNGNQVTWEASDFSQLANLEAGTYPVRVIALDNRGKTGETTHTITVTADGGNGGGNSNMPPMVNITNPSNGQTFTAGDDINVRASASDSDGSVEYLELFFNDISANKDTSSPYSWSITNISEGNHTLRVIASDNEGATTETSISITANANSGGGNGNGNNDGTPVVNISTPSDGQTFGVGTNLTVSASATDSDGSIRNLRLYFNGEFINKTNSANATWSGADFDQLANLQEGSYPVRVIAVDNKGNMGETTHTITVVASLNDDPTVLAKATPTAASIVIENEEVQMLQNIPPSISITSPQDGDTFPAGTNLTVTAEASDEDGTVKNARMYFNGDFIRKINNPPYQWDATTDPVLANLPAGEHSIRVGAVDNRNASSETTITITVTDDNSPNVPPTVNFTTPSEGDTFPVGTNLNVEVAASDSDGSITGVDLFINNVFVRNEALPPYIWGEFSPNTDVRLQNLAAGSYELKAIATDNEGATTESIITILISDDDGTGGNNMPPSVSFVSPTNGMIFEAGAGLDVEVSASDSDGTITGVELFFNDEFVRREGVAPYNWGPQTPHTDEPLESLRVGRHTLKAVAIDNAGARTETTITIEVNGSATSGGDNGTPIVSILSPEDGDTFPVGANIDVVADAMDTDGSIRNVRMFFNDELVRKLNQEPYRWDASEYDVLANLQAGQYLIKVVAVDNRGNISEVTIAITVADDDTPTNVAPTISFANLTDGQSLMEGTPIVVTANASDSDGTVTQVELFDNGTLISADATAPYEWTLSSLAIGNHNLRLVATDDDGATSEVSIMISIDSADNAVPTVSFANLTDGQRFVEGMPITVIANASDSDGTITQVELFDNGTLISADATAPYEWTLSSLAIGNHNLKLVATDDDGATSEVSIMISIDSAENAAPTVSFVTPTDGQSFVEGTPVVVSANASDNDGTIAQVELFNNGNLISADATAPYEWSLPFLTVRDHNLKLVATDDDGATSETSLTISVVADDSGNGGNGTPTSAGGDNGTPKITITAPFDGNNFPTGTDLTVTAEAEDFDGTVRNVRMYLNGDFIRKINRAPYQWDTTTDPELANMQDGTYDIRVGAVDNQGNSSEVTITVTIGGSSGGGGGNTNTAPSVSFANLTDGQTFTEGNDINVTANASDSDGTVAQVALFNNGTLVSTDLDAPYNWTIQGLTIGTYDLMLTATDDDGATQSTSLSINVEADDDGGGNGGTGGGNGGSGEPTTVGGDNGTPIVTILEPFDGENFPVGTDLTVRSTAEDTDGTIRNVRLNFAGSTVSKLNDAPYEWDANNTPELANLQAGTYEIIVAAVNSRGRVTQAAITISIGDDGGNTGGGGSDTPPIVEFVTPTNGANFEVGTNLFVEATATDSDGTISHVDLYFDNVFVRQEIGAPYQWGSGTSHSDDLLNNLQPGTHTLRVVATDNDGNTAEQSIAIQVDPGDTGGTDALIEIENMTKMPFLNESFPSDNIYSFCRLDRRPPTALDLHNRNRMRIHNRGTSNLVISEITITDTSEFTLPNNEWERLPLIITPGNSYDLLIQFVERQGNRGFRLGQIELTTNDTSQPIVSAELRGAYHPRAEGNAEPMVKTIIRTLGFQTNLGNGLNSALYPTVEDVESGFHGDIVLSETWEQADMSQPVIGFNLAVYKGGSQTNAGSGLNTRFVETGTLAKVGNFNFNTCVEFHQSILAKNQSCRSYDLIGGASRDNVGGPFRIVMDGYISDGKGERDPITGRRRLLGIRLYQVIDENGISIPNHYIAINDYVKNGCTELDGATIDDEFANCDWNDNITYFINIRPVDLIAVGGVRSQQLEQRTANVVKELSIHPNPVSDQLIVDLADFDGEAVQIMLQDQVGQIVKTIAFQSDHARRELLDLAELQSGFYTLTAIANGTRLTKKFVVSKN